MKQIIMSNTERPNPLVYKQKILSTEIINRMQRTQISIFSCVTGTENTRLQKVHTIPD